MISNFILTMFDRPIMSFTIGLFSNHSSISNLIHKLNCRERVCWRSYMY